MADADIPVDVNPGHISPMDAVTKAKCFGYNTSFYIVLVEPSHPGNIGSVARAMKTMGFRQLILVNPKQFPHADATAFASGATDVLDKALVVTDLSLALAPMRWVVGVSARVRDIPLPCVTPREFTVDAFQDKHMPTAIVFGNEQSGLSNDDLAHCHQQIRIPTASDYGSLNLAQAVQIICYELAQGIFALTSGDTPNSLNAGRALLGNTADSLNAGRAACRGFAGTRKSKAFSLRTPLLEQRGPVLICGCPVLDSTLKDNVELPAPQQDFDGMFDHWCDVLEAAHYLHPQQRQKMLIRMRQLLMRTEPSVTEITMLRGAFRNILRHITK